MMHTIIWTLFITFLTLQYTGNIDARRCKPKPILQNNTRPGRCPHPQYVSSSLNCSTEGNDSVCPWNYKCCPLAQGMQCFAPCPEWSTPCTLNCTFGLKVDPSPCTTCQCADDPCIARNCPRGTTCNVIQYEPCSVAGRCGVTTICVKNPFNGTGDVPKPNLCPSFWSYPGAGLVTCNGSDADCPLDQKCCAAPDSSFGPVESKGQINYCVDPCLDLTNCTLTCSNGFRLVNNCYVCECAIDECLTVSCPPGQQCQLIPAPCAYYPGRPPCPQYPVCM